MLFFSLFKQIAAFWILEWGWSYLRHQKNWNLACEKRKSRQTSSKTNTLWLRTCWSGAGSVWWRAGRWKRSNAPAAERRERRARRSWWPPLPPQSQRQTAACIPDSWLPPRAMGRPPPPDTPKQSHQHRHSARICLRVWALQPLTAVTSSTHTHTHTRAALQQLSFLPCCFPSFLSPALLLIEALGHLCANSVCIFWFPSHSWLVVGIDAYMQIMENNNKGYYS